MAKTINEDIIIEYLENQGMIEQDSDLDTPITISIRDLVFVISEFMESEMNEFAF